MKNIYKLFLTSLSFLILSISISAQISLVRSGDLSLVFKADSTSRSVLLSNVLETQPGNQSPIIGIAGWTENGKTLQCRSLLYFDYGSLPQMLEPDEIVKAQLVLVPLQINNNTTNNNNDIQFSKFRVRRVTESWDENAATWAHQPLTNEKDEVIKKINPEKKDDLVKIDVTRLVKNMFRYGNNGFMIQFEDSISQTASFGHWFASTKIANQDLRPVLIITYSAYRIQALGPTSTWAIPTNTSSGIQLDERSKALMIPSMAAPTGPVKEPVNAPVNNKPPEPVKD